ncbi:3-oxoacyl-ACP reductase [Leucobacter zeae]|nr:3-oxoacyl-ACP reductase [Leucobacter zeae]
MTHPATPEPASEPVPDAAPERRMPSSQPILMRAMRWGIIASVALIVVFGVIGWFVSGTTGLVGGVLGAAFAGIFLAMTIGSITFANRFIQSDMYVVAFFGIVMGTWVLKFVAFLVAAVLLRDEPWLNPTVLFLGVVAGVIVSLVIDVVIVAKSRLPIVSDPQ